MDVDDEYRTKEEVNADGAHVYDDWKSIVVDADNPNKKLGEYRSNYHPQEQGSDESPVKIRHVVDVFLGKKSKLRTAWSIYGVVVAISLLAVLSFMVMRLPISWGNALILIIFVIAGLPAIGIVLVIITVIKKVNENTNREIARKETGEAISNNSEAIVQNYNPISDDGAALAQNYKICDAAAITLAVVAISAFACGWNLWLTEGTIILIAYIAIAVPFIYLIALICKTRKGYKYSPAFLLIIPGLVAYPVLHILKENVYADEAVLKVASIAVFMGALLLAILAREMREKQKIPIVKAIAAPILIIVAIVFLMMPFIVYYT
jgi:hypothetical protein